MSGDYAEFARPMEPGALEFPRRLGIPRGANFLDVGCSAGRTALPVARAGARVTAVEIASNWVEHTRSRARNEGLDVQVEEGDAEELTQPNDAFDVVLSTFAAVFAIIGRYVPPPAMPSPPSWENEDILRARVADRVSSLEITRRHYPFESPFGPAQVAEFFRAHYGPTHRAFAALDTTRQAAMRDELVHLWSDLNETGDGTTRFHGENLELTAFKT